MHRSSTYNVRPPVGDFYRGYLYERQDFRQQRRNYRGSYSLQQLFHPSYVARDGRHRNFFRPHKEPNNQLYAYPQRPYHHQNNYPEGVKSMWRVPINAQGERRTLGRRCVGHFLPSTGRSQAGNRTTVSYVDQCRVQYTFIYEDLDRYLPRCHTCNLCFPYRSFLKQHMQTYDHVQKTMIYCGSQMNYSKTNMESSKNTSSTGLEEAKDGSVGNLGLLLSQTSINPQNVKGKCEFVNTEGEITEGGTTVDDLITFSDEENETEAKSVINLNHNAHEEKSCAATLFKYNDASVRKGSDEQLCSCGMHSP
uniref:C2H2-type domain-containing protein n=1 Tax=Trichuris muris TaxID=70415 RepID=A0A5S6Q7E5_TRIMR